MGPPPIHLQGLFSLLPDFQSVKKLTAGMAVTSHLKSAWQPHTLCLGTPTHTHTLEAHPSLPTQKFNFLRGTHA